MEVLTLITLIIVLQYASVSKQYVIHFKLTECYVNLNKKQKNKKP